MIPRINVEAAQEDAYFPALFLPRVGFGAGFSKNTQNKHNGQIRHSINKNLEKQRKRLEII